MDTNINYILKNYQDYESMSHEAALAIANMAKHEIDKKGYFTLVLSGGKTPKGLYSILANQIIDWKNIILFWGDERFVSHDNHESNFNMTCKSLLSKIDIPDTNINPIPTKTSTPKESAVIYESNLHLFFEKYSKSNYSFDCILLGIGEDGHTASLFPGSPVLNEKIDWVKNVTAPPTYSIRERITLTLPIINRSKCILFLVSGDSKRPVIKSILNTNSEAAIYPAQLVRPAGKVYLYTDINL